MDKQEHDLKERTTETDETEGTEQPEEQHDRFKETTEKIWGSTKSAWNSATFKANQYKQLVQKKIDLSALHKKIHGAHADLGKLIDDLREAGKKSIMNLAEVREILTRLDELKAEAASLEEQVEKIRNEVPLQEDVPEEEKSV